jgi:hypothetical protein
MDPIHQSHLSALCEERKRNREKDEERLHVRVQEREIGDPHPSGLGRESGWRRDFAFHLSKIR